MNYCEMDADGREYELGDEPIYGIASSHNGQEYVVWSTLRGTAQPKWFVGATDGALVWSASLDPLQMAQSASLSLAAFSSTFASAVVLGRTHAALLPDSAAGPGGLCLTLWRGSQSSEYRLSPVVRPDSRTRLVLANLVDLTRRINASSPPAGLQQRHKIELDNMRAEMDRMAAELARLRQQQLQQLQRVDADDSGGTTGVNWALGSKRAKSKNRKANGAVPDSNSPKKKVHRDLINPSVPDRKKKQRKAIEYRGTPAASIQ